MRRKVAPIVGAKAGPEDGLKDGEFEAYASVFGNVDSYGDVVTQGAFAESLKEWEGSGLVIPALWGHNFADPDYNIGHVVKATEDERGLRVRVLLDLDSPKAAQVYRLLKGGRVSQMSFAFDVLDGAPGEKDGEDVYELRRLKLYEVSVVPIGANQETEVLAVKEAAEHMTASIRDSGGLSVKAVDALRGVRDAIDRAVGSAGHGGKADESAGGNGEAVQAGRKSEADPGALARITRLNLEIELEQNNDLEGV